MPCCSASIRVSSFHIVQRIPYFLSVYAIHSVAKKDAHILSVDCSYGFRCCFVLNWLKVAALIYDSYDSTLTFKNSLIHIFHFHIWAYENNTWNISTNDVKWFFFFAQTNKKHRHIYIDFIFCYWKWKLLCNFWCNVEKMWFTFDTKYEKNPLHEMSFYVCNMILFC